MPTVAPGQHSKSLHNNAVCKFHCRRDLVISAFRCGGKIYINISMGISYWLNELLNIGISDISKNLISCIPSMKLFKYIDKVLLYPGIITIKINLI